LPLISSIFEKSKIVKEVNKVMLIIGSSFAVMMVVYFIFNGLIIRIILSEEFLPINQLMLLQMIGDFFRVLGWVIGFVVISRASIKLYLLGEVFQGLLFVTLSYFSLIKYHDINSIIVSYDITCFLYFILSVSLFAIFFVKKDNSSLNSKIIIE
jgi:PST family polysaccharide transporter/antigen flippase